MNELIHDSIPDYMFENNKDDLDLLATLEDKVVLVGNGLIKYKDVDVSLTDEEHDALMELIQEWDFMLL